MSITIFFIFVFASCQSSSQNNTLASEPHEINQTTVTPLGKTIIHEDITATLFWIGEAQSEDNQQITNVESAWNDNWQIDYGGIDTPIRRKIFPSFRPKENPFYFALPYNDFDDNGNRREDAKNIIPWAKEKAYKDNESMVKNRWIKITDQNQTVYAQWEDAGPFEYDDIAYVFGTATPKNSENNHAGLDLSPAVWIYLGYDTTNMDNQAKMSWQFVPETEVPNGPWKEIVTYSQIHWE